MNAYVVKTRDRREYVEPIPGFYGDGPRFPIWPMSPVVAETPAQAKQLFLIEFAHSRSNSGVETDDWTELRVRLLAKDVPVAAGIYEFDEDLWFRIHEIEQHDGKRCDCPTEEGEE